MENLLLNNIKEHLEVISRLVELENDVVAACRLCIETIRNDGKLLFCGNGGSAADSQHLAAEFTGRFINDRKPLPAIALSTDTSALTCIGNDYGFDDVFARQILAIGSKRDCLIAISTSGNSLNVIKALQAAKSVGMRSIGLLGRDGGKIATMCDLHITVPSHTTARIQEAHILIGHTLCGFVEQGLGLAVAE